jgi:adenylate cyclase
MAIRSARERVVLGVLVLAVSGLFAGGALARLDRAWFDAGARLNRAWGLQPMHEDVVIVGIDERFLETVDEPLALSHRYLARLMGILATAQPSVVGLDVVLPEKRFDTLAPVAAPDTDYHRILVAGLLRAVQSFPLVVAKAWDADRGHYRDLQADYVAVLETQPEGFAPQASVLLCPDPDGVLRRYPGADCQPDGSEATFASEVAAAAGKRVQAGDLIDYGLGGEFLYVPMHEVFALEAAGNQARLAQLFEGRIVLVGAILDETDVLALPVPLAEWRPGDTRVPGVLAHAQMVRNAVAGSFVRTVPVAVPWILIVVAGVLAGIARRPLAGALAAGAIVAGVAVASLVLLRAGTWLAPTGPALAAVVVAIAGVLMHARRSRHQRSRMREAFAGYVDAATLDRLATARGTACDATGRRVAFLECRIDWDVDARHADALSSAGSAVLDRIAACVHRHGGMIDVLSGSRVSAFFGAPETLACPEKNALEAAADIVDTDTDTDTGASAGRVQVRVALHAGPALTALVPAAGRTHYTVLGAEHGVTARLLAATGDMPIVCSDAIVDALGAPPFLQRLPGGGHGWDPRAVAGTQEARGTTA